MRDRHIDGSGDFGVARSGIAQGQYGGITSGQPRHGCAHRGSTRGTLDRDGRIRIASGLCVDRDGTRKVAFFPGDAAPIAADGVERQVERCTLQPRSSELGIGGMPAVELHERFLCGVLGLVSAQARAQGDGANARILSEEQPLERVCAAPRARRCFFCGHRPGHVARLPPTLPPSTWEAPPGRIL